MNYKDDFPMLGGDIIYFDNGATTFKPKSVVEAMDEYYYKYCANAHRGDYDISLKVNMAYEKTRDKVCAFLNARSREEIIFTKGATEALNMIVLSFFAHILEPGDEVLLTESEHASNVLPWYKLAKEKGIVVRFIPLDDNLHVTLNNVKNSITPNTKVISIAELTNVVGDVRPIKEITEYAHSKGIFVVVDGAQSVAHKPTDVQATDVDFLAFSAHKMCGPTGVGVLYGKQELLEEFDPLYTGGGMNESFR